MNTFPTQKESVFRVILVRIFPAFSRIRTEYGEVVRICPYSVRKRENAGKMRIRKTLNTDTFYAVIAIHILTNISKNKGNQAIKLGQLMELLSHVSSIYLANSNS